MLWGITSITNKMNGEKTMNKRTSTMAKWKVRQTHDPQQHWQLCYCKYQSNVMQKNKNNNSNNNKCQTSTCLSTTKKVVANGGKMPLHWRQWKQWWLLSRREQMEQNSKKREKATTTSREWRCFYCIVIWYEQFLAIMITPINVDRMAVNEHSDWRNIPI